MAEFQVDGGLDPLAALSPLDGRYGHDLDPLRPFFSEQALVARRLRVELRYLQHLLPMLKQELSEPLAARIEALLSPQQMSALVQAVKAHEAVTRHDVKAVEYALADALKPDFESAINWLHWGLTSEDVNNLAYALMLSESYQQVLLPDLRELLRSLVNWIEQTAEMPMLARTHGQAASPTTIGKEYAVYAQRLLGEIQHLETLLPVSGKLNGATGNWHLFAQFFPEQDWQPFSQQVVESLGLAFEPISTQIVCRESYARVLDATRRIHDILIDCARDTWHYISLGYFKLKPRSSTEVGSSTMPHKINPVLFENAEGNLEIANGLLQTISSKLLKSRLQRDLSDSTVLRNMGVALGHGYLAWQNLKRGLAQLEPNTAVLQQDLNSHWEVLAEPLQHALRLQGRDVPYDLIRRHTQGLQMNQENWQDLMASVDVELAIESPSAYTGYAAKLAREVCQRSRDYLDR